MIMAICRGAGRLEKGQQADRQERSVLCSGLLSRCSGGRDGRMEGWKQASGKLPLDACGRAVAYGG